MDRSQRVTKNEAFLNYLIKAGPIQLQGLISVSSDEELLTVCEFVLNYIEGNLKSPNDLSRRGDFLKTLASTSIKLNNKRDILNNSKTYRLVLQRFLRSVL